MKSQHRTNSSWLWLLIAVPFVVAGAIVGILADRQPAREAEYVATVAPTVTPAPVVAPVAPSDSLTDEELSELVDQPTLAYGAIAKAEQDPHTWPEWHHKRKEVADAHPTCQWHGCTDRGKFIHHGIPVNFVVEAGFPEMVYSEQYGQTFWALCNEHHKQAHLIGVVEHGSYARTFDPNIAESVKRGRSVGKWPFEAREDAIKWVKLQAKQPSKTTLAP